MSHIVSNTSLPRFLSWSHTKWAVQREKMGTLEISDPIYIVEGLYYVVPHKMGCTQREDG